MNRSTIPKGLCTYLSKSEVFMRLAIDPFLQLYVTKTIFCPLSILWFFNGKLLYYFIFAENRLHDEDTDETDDDIFSEDVTHTQNTPKQQTSSTSSYGRYRKHFQRKLQVSVYPTQHKYVMWYEWGDQFAKLVF